MLDVPVARGDDPLMIQGPAATFACPSCGGINLPLPARTRLP
ncbi:MAG TPA: hypothetical protein VK838_00670 [Candidatus Limnocylindrales bacterium]|nr:hypothetical protein [Candidatus Limnocylindrales bacterium]